MDGKEIYIRFADLSTSAIVDELSRRDGIKAIWVAPDEEKEIKVEGAAIVLIVND